MFTGIIESLGEVFQITDKGSLYLLSIRSQLARQLKVGESVAHSGVCLTVEQVKAEQESYRVAVIAESLRKTTLKNIQLGEQLNLERALAASGRFEGHFVQGHVDTVARIEQALLVDQRREFWLIYPADFEGLVVERGSIAVDGISLTIAESEQRNRRLLVAIIPHTWQNTNAAAWKEGREVNIEFDILGKYVQKLAAQAYKPKGGGN